MQNIKEVRFIYESINCIFILPGIQRKYRFYFKWPWTSALITLQDIQDQKLEWPAVLGRESDWCARFWVRF